MPEPIAPAEPDVTVTPPIDQPDAAADAEAAEWDEIAKETYPNLLEDKKKDEEKEPEKTDPAKPADPENPEAAAPSEEAKTETPADPVASPASTADLRATQREMSVEFDAVKKDVALELFKDLPLELKDADGDPIRGVEDVMKLVDPRTGATFTEESAATWYLQAKDGLSKMIQEADEQANRITLANIGLKDDADRLQKEFGEILKANPDAMKTVWSEYSKTLKMSSGGKIVVEAPVSLYSFVKTAISPYATAAKAQAEAAVAKDAADKAARSQQRQSRSDIFGSGKTDTMTDDEKEWADAVREYYGK